MEPVPALLPLGQVLEHFARIVGLKAGRIAFDLPTSAVTREMLAQLYGSEFEQLERPGPLALALPPEILRPVVVHCR